MLTLFVPVYKGNPFHNSKVPICFETHCNLRCEASHSTFSKPLKKNQKNNHHVGLKKNMNGSCFVERYIYCQSFREHLVFSHCLSVIQ